MNNNEIEQDVRVSVPSCTDCTAPCSRRQAQFISNEPIVSFSSFSPYSDVVVGNQLVGVLLPPHELDYGSEQVLYLK